MNKKNFLLLVFLLVYLSAYADHTVCFSYDSGGNRISQSVLSPVAAPTYRFVSANTTTEITTSSFNNISLHVSPNPTEGLLHIELEQLPEGESYQYVITGIGGSIVCKEETTSNPSLVDLSSFPEGIYVLMVYCFGTEKEFKIIKK